VRSFREPSTLRERQVIPAGRLWAQMREVFGLQSTDGKGHSLAKEFRLLHMRNFAHQLRDCVIFRKVDVM
jgi:hypothetical protein